MEISVEALQNTNNWITIGTKYTTSEYIPTGILVSTTYR